MPTSNIYIIPTVIETVKRLKPGSILDFGIGFGKYGFLIREYLDVQRLLKGFSGNLSDNFVTKIDGIEINSRYVCEIQRRIYNQIYIGDGIKIIDTLGTYDVVLLLDVLEHFTKEEGFILLEKIYKKVAGTLVIVTPAFEYKQDEIYDNKNEKHLSVWKVKDFSKYANLQYKIICGGEVLLILIHKNSSSLRIPFLGDWRAGGYLLKELMDISFEISARGIRKSWRLLKNLKKIKHKKQKEAQFLCQK